MERSLPRETASAVARPCVPPESRLQKNEVAAPTSNHGLTPTKRGVSLVQRPFIKRRSSAFFGEERGKPRWTNPVYTMGSDDFLTRAKSVYNG